MMDLFGTARLKVWITYDPDPIFGQKFRVRIYNRDTDAEGFGMADDLDAAIAQAKARLAEEMAS